MAVAPPMTVRMLSVEAAADKGAMSSVRGLPLAAPVVTAAPVPAPVGSRFTDTRAAALPADVRSVRQDAPVVATAASTVASEVSATGPSSAASSAVAARVLPPELPPAPEYLMGGKLDPGPRPLSTIEPSYPERANLQEGKVVLRLLINEAGEVDNAAVVRAYPEGLFEESALAAFSPAKFSPGMLLGVPVKSQVTIEVEFVPINRGSKVSGRSY